MRKKIGVALPMYNTLPFIETCLRSLIDQTYPVKIYMVDDASTEVHPDGYTLYDFLKGREDNYLKGHVLERNSENLGWPKTLNRAAKLAIDDGCDYVFVMNADDWLRIDAIERMLAELEETKSDWVNCNGQQIGGENVVMACKKDATLDDFRDHTVLTNWALIRPEVWNSVGGYSEDLAINDEIKAGYEDYEFWVKMMLKGYKYSVVEYPLYYYRMHDGQLHIKTVAHHKEAREMIFKKHNLFINR